MAEPRTDPRSALPPHSLEAERWALGAMMLGTDASQEAVAVAAGMITEQDFYRASHQAVFRAILQLSERGEKVDLVTVADALGRAGDLESAGGRAYLAGLLDEMPLVANLESYLKIIQEKSSMRRLMDIGHRLLGSATAGVGEAEALIQAATQRLYEVSITGTRGGLVSVKKMVLPTMEKLTTLSQRAMSEEGFITGLPTGFHWLDQMTSGLQGGEMIVLAARPGMGKTSLALNIAMNVAEAKGIPVLIFSIEMSAHDLVLRLLCSRAQVDSHDVRKGRLYGEDRNKIHLAANILNEMPIWIDESSRLTPLEVRSRVRRVLGETKAPQALVIVDYMQLMDFTVDWGGSRPENRQQEITSISRSLKAVAKELGIPILVLSQLSRAPERRDEKKIRPRLSDLRESGSIEQDADAVLMIYQDPAENRPPEDGSIPLVINARVALAKNRNGPTGTFPLEFHKPFTRFYHREHHQLLPEDE